MTRRYDLGVEDKQTQLVDIGLPHHVVSPQGSEVPDKAEGGSHIPDECFDEFYYLAKYVYKHNPEATIYDVFEWMRLNVLGGTEYGPSLIERITREVETELGPWT